MISKQLVANGSPMRIELQRVHFMPKQLEPGILYVSQEFETAAHLCACGCGTKIRTPLGPTEWSVTETPNGPSLWPSIGNWQHPCQSHYIIRRGEIIWAKKWSKSEIASGRLKEERRRQRYYADLERKKGGSVRCLLDSLKKLWKDKGQKN